MPLYKLNFSQQTTPLFRANAEFHSSQRAQKSARYRKTWQNTKNSANPKNSAKHSKIGLSLLFTKPSFYQKARGFVVGFFDFIVFCVA